MGLGVFNYNHQAVESPFTREVLEAHLPRRRKKSRLTQVKGEGTCRACQYNMFIYGMRMYFAPGALTSGAFPSTLAAAARKWFRRLSPGTIESFDPLSTSKLFISQFMSPLYGKKPITHLFPDKQRRDELLLKESVGRFNHEAVAYCDDELQINDLISGLQANHGNIYDVLNRELLISIERNHPKSYIELLDKKL